MNAFLAEGMNVATAVHEATLLAVERAQGFAERL